MDKFQIFRLDAEGGVEEWVATGEGAAPALAVIEAAERVGSDLMPSGRRFLALWVGHANGYGAVALAGDLRSDGDSSRNRGRVFTLRRDAVSVEPS